ncbi:hypothetical protein DH09_03015 [Bacillaceae bacterium JMAK1]|nr:hypothetical protein DH09_03015 [Bacillaceae bacterium JMAK1]
MSDTIQLIVVLAVITYMSRLIGLEIMTKINVTPAIKTYLQYVPISIITALVVIQIMTPEGNLTYFSIPITIAAVSSGVTMFLSKSLALSLIVGMICGIVTRMVV